jgi:hypothetical protein
MLERVPYCCIFAALERRGRSSDFASGAHFKFLKSVRWRTTLIAATVLLRFSLASADPPTLVDLQQLWKQHDLAGVVKGCTDALAPGGTTDPAERFKIAWLKGETQLQLQQADAAVDAFNAASKETENVRQQSVAKATAILIGRSKDFIYTSLTIKPSAGNAPVVKRRRPRSPSTSSSPGQAMQDAAAATQPVASSAPVILPRGQFDIIDPRHRAEAFDAMWSDERNDAEQTIKDKTATKSLPAINDALDRIKLAEPIAVAANHGDWVQTQKDKLANAARIDANTEMRAMNDALVTIVKEQAVRRRGNYPKPMPQGERDQINATTKELDQITAELTALSASLNADKDTFRPQLDQASRLQDRATTALATD